MADGLKKITHGKIKTFSIMGYWCNETTYILISLLSSIIFIFFIGKTIQEEVLRLKEFSTASRGWDLFKIMRMLFSKLHYQSDIQPSS